MTRFIQLTSVFRTQDPEDEIVTEGTRPISIAVDSIRSFRPRSGDRIGTRVTLRDGTHYPVRELYGEVQDAVMGMPTTVGSSASN
jgi:hypothetical protein